MNDLKNIGMLFFRSSIHGRGLFCKRNIDAGELVIEYAGEVIRSILADKREKIYQSKVSYMSHFIAFCPSFLRLNIFLD